MHINSPGGDVFSAVAIANMLRAQRTEKKRVVETSIEGLAASAATIISAAGSPIRIADNALMMIHNPWSVGVGEASEMRKVAEELDKVRDQIIATYRWTSELSEDEIGTLMDATTWMDAGEAVERGFATEIVEGMRAAAAFSFRSFAEAVNCGGFGDSITPEIWARLEGVMADSTKNPAADEEEREKEKAEETEEEETEEAKGAEGEEEREEETEETEGSRPSNVVDFDQRRAELRTAARAERDAEIRSLKFEIGSMCKAARRPDLEGRLFDVALEGGLSIEASRAKLFDLMSEGPEITNSTAPISAPSENKTIIDAIVRGSKRA